MSSIFRKDDKSVKRPNRNSYPKTHVKALSTKFGQIMPVACFPVMPSETIELKWKHIFNMLPLVFPVQTRVRASMQAYYVRYRNLWEDWEDFQFKMKPNLVKPYLRFTKAMQKNLLRLGGPLDNLGVNVVTKHDVPTGIGLDMPDIPQKSQNGVYNPYTTTYDDYGIAKLSIDRSFFTGTGVAYVEFDEFEVKSSQATDELAATYAPYRYPVFPINGRVQVNTSNETYFLIECYKYVDGYISRDVTIDPTLNRQDFADDVSRQDGSTIGSKRGTITNTIKSEGVVRTQEVKYFIASVPANGGVIYAPDGYQLGAVLGVYYASGQGYLMPTDVEVMVNPSMYGDRGIHLSDVTLKYLPYANVVRDDNKTIRLDAGPLRAFESVYNARVRHPENNPFKINGQPEYNKYLLSVAGGPDEYNYPQRYANWQDDMFTTALHTPQHGEAPLVGLVNQNPTGVQVTFANDDGTTSRVRFLADSDMSSPGAARNLRVASVWSGNDSQPPVNSPSSVSDGYVGQLQEAMIEAVKFGITINDFRNVNSFQRWLENNVRKGYRYRDQIKAHYAINVRYDTLQMPEYLGGTSRDMIVNQITQTTENSEGVLGDYAGQAYINGESKKIKFMADEEGFVIVTLSIMPMANYSTAIPKYWLRENALDYFSPEFGKIGYQPILNREIDPVGSFFDNTGDKIFGYNRPWYDYISSFSSIHGKFRTEFQNFVLTRTFDKTPTLSEEFLVFDPDQLNNIFYVDDDEDKILGQILFEYNSKLPIPIHGVAALE